MNYSEIHPSKLRITRLTSGPGIYLLCALISVILFAAALYTDDIINDDGMDYIYAAFDYSHGDTTSARRFRPEKLFYNQFGVLSKYTGLSLLQSAYTLSLLAQIALMCGFIAVVRSLGGSTSVQLLALMVIASMVHFNELRPHIIKGFGFWAAQLWAIWAIINFAHNSRWRYLLGWAALSIISMAFRIEAIVYLAGMALLIPLIIKGRPRKRFVLSGAAILVGTLALASANQLFFKQGDLVEVNLSKKVKTELARAAHVTDTLNKQKELLRDTMPNKWARNSASHFLIGGLLFEVTKIVLYTSNGLLLILALIYGKATLIPKTVNHRIIASYFLIGIIISFYTIASRFFITDRYVFLPALLLCIPIPYLLGQLLPGLNRQTWGKRYILRGAIFIIPALIITAPVIKNSNEKMYIPEAAQWLKGNLLTIGSTYYNDQKLAFYSGNYANRSFQHQVDSVEQLRHEGYRYVVIHTEKSSPLKISSLLVDNDNIELLHSTRGQRHGKVDIYEVLAIADPTLAPAH